MDKQAKDENEATGGPSALSAGLGLLSKIDTHLRQLAPHMQQRDGVVLLREARDVLRSATAMASRQAEDEALWCEANTVFEAYLQTALRNLAAAIETPNAKVQADGEGFISPVAPGTTGYAADTN